MRTPSRCMPPRPDRRPGRLARIVLTALAGALLAGALVAFAMRPALTAVAGLVIGLLWMRARAVERREIAALQALAASRDGGTICRFAREFDRRTVDPWVVRAVYEQVQRELAHAHPAFPLRADDRLVEDLRIDHEALDMEIAVDIAARTGRPLDDGDRNPWSGRVRTMRDLVMFFQGQPRRA